MVRLLLALLLALSTGCAGDDPESAADAGEPAADTPTAEVVSTPAGTAIADLVSTSPRLGTLERLIDAAGLIETLRDTSSAYTLFAPSDDAWAAFDGLAELEADPERLRRALLGHVVPTRLLSLDVFADLAIDAVSGVELAFAEAGDGLVVVGPWARGQIEAADLDASNGVVHVVDAVLVAE